MLNSNLQEIFNRRNTFSREEKIAVSAKEYKKMEDAFKGVLGSFTGWSTALDMALAIAAADGRPSMDEYQIFKRVTNKSPSYEEFLSSTASMSKKFVQAIQEANKYGREVKLAVAVYALGYCAIKGYITEPESLFINDLVR